MVRVRLVEGGSKAGFGRSEEGVKVPWRLKAEARAERNRGVRTRSFMVVDGGGREGGRGRLWTL